MTTVHLHRTRSDKNGTFGVMYLGGKPVAVTCEDPWKYNRRGESCIPEGKYKCVPHSGPKYSNVWEVTGVENRDAILIHAGNTTDDTQGCILVGTKFGELNGKPAVLQSQSALLRLRATLPREFWLHVMKGEPE